LLQIQVNKLLPRTNYLWIIYIVIRFLPLRLPLPVFLLFLYFEEVCHQVNLIVLSDKVWATYFIFGIQICFNNWVFEFWGWFTTLY